jgi:hypothetical protein
LTQKFGDEFLLSIFTTEALRTQRKFIFSFAGRRRQTKTNVSIEQLTLRNGVPSKMVDFGHGQGRSDVATAGVAVLRRGLQRARTPAWAERCHFWTGTAN